MQKSYQITVAKPAGYSAVKWWCGGPHFEVVYHYIMKHSFCNINGQTYLNFWIEHSHGYEQKQTGKVVCGVYFPKTSSLITEFTEQGLSI